MDKYTQKQMNTDNKKPQLDDCAFHGIAGQIVGLIDPHTEADPKATLLQFLVAFGNILNQTAFYKVSADKHYMNLFLLLVGCSSKGRKGTSWNCVKNIFEHVDLDWAKKSIKKGLSSGEGLIYHVRDTEAEEQELDKRLFIIESEFAGVLKVLSREGNTLSSVIRDAWDGTTLSTLTKNSAMSATNAHISIIGHITANELLRYLSETEVANGFGNRFLWSYVERSKILPRGGELDTVDFSLIYKELQLRIDYIKKKDFVINFDEEAQKEWDKIYTNLSQEKSGFAGILTNRNEAQMIRVASIYALLDASFEIKIQHLKAALAVIKYSTECAYYIFGDSIGDPVADKILEALKNATNGLTKTDIHNLFNRNKGTRQIDLALTMLINAHRVISTIEYHNGRPIDKWYVNTINEFDEIR